MVPVWRGDMPYLWALKPRSTTFEVLKPQCQIVQVLSTDMARHTKFLGEFKTLIDSRCVSEAGTDSPRMMTIATQLSDSYPDRALVVSAIVHNADLANCTKDWPLAKKWTYRLMEEFCAEGDEERRQGLPLGPLNDRETMDIPKGQVLTATLLFHVCCCASAIPLV
jgi:hypothetical protein